MKNGAPDATVCLFHKGPHVNYPLVLAFVAGPTGTQIRRSSWARAHSSPMYLSRAITSNSHGANLEPKDSPLWGPIFSPFMSHMNPT